MTDGWTPAPCNRERPLQVAQGGLAYARRKRVQWIWEESLWELGIHPGRPSPFMQKRVALLIDTDAQVRFEAIGEKYRLPSEALCTCGHVLGVHRHAEACRECDCAAFLHEREIVVTVRAMGEPTAPVAQVVTIDCEATVEIGP